MIWATFSILLLLIHLIDLLLSWWNIDLDVQRCEAAYGNKYILNLHLTVTFWGLGFQLVFISVFKLRVCWRVQES